MEFVAGLRRRPLEVETITKSREGAPTSLVESLAFTHDCFQPVGKKGTDRPPLFGGNHAGFSKQIRVEFQGDVGFHEPSWHVK